AERTSDLVLHDPIDAPPLRWGILGAGHIARKFVTDLRDHTRSTVTAVASRDAERAQVFAENMQVDHAFGSYEELLASDEVDAVYVSTIHPTHEEVATLALEAGIPTLVEKPLTLDAAQAARIVDTARAKNTFFMEAMWTRHLPQHLVMQALLKAGTLGEILTVHADHGQLLWHVPRLVHRDLGGGALLDLGVYPVSFVHDILGDDVEVQAASSVLTSEGVDASSAVVLRGKCALATATANLNARSATAAEVVCSGGAIELPTQFYRPGTLRLRTFPGEGLPDDVVEWNAWVPGGFQYQIAEVARCVAAGALESERMHWDSSVAVMRTLDRVREITGISYE
ncbi:MAG: Gfo/Idh/MocA family oxidoreductase, partial [Actinomycetaceae bacterium]|nr:Gfo/Idh/MocA family oxidoreductase [Actinomycetaceae bacterium]